MEFKYVKFFSGKANAELTAEVIGSNKYTALLKLPDGKIIRKKWRQIDGI